MNSSGNIFRYRDCNPDNIDSLQNDYLWFSSINFLNDPFDGIIDYTWDKKEDHLIFEEIDRNYPKLQGFDKDFLQKTMDLANHEYSLKDPIMISCFSRSFSNILMWSHYAKSHTGFCEVFKWQEISKNIYGIKIDVKSFRKSEINLLVKNKYIPLVPVIYNNKKVSPVLSSETNTFNGIQQRLTCYFQKSEDWQYEKEHRAVVYFDSLLEKNKLYYPKKSLVSIIMGSEISDDNYKKIFEICKRKKISLAKMKKVYNEYKLIPERII